MSLILGLGSNLGNRINNIEEAIKKLSEHFELISKASFYSSAAVDYLNQPDFINTAVEFKTPEQNPSEVIKIILNIEFNMGRRRDIPKGPRTIDIDILFWDLEKINLEYLQVPHPSWQDRSFVVRPLQELPYFQTLQNHFIIPTNFNNSCERL